MTTHQIYAWEVFMARALRAGLLAFVVVFLAGVLLGWPYGLMIGALIALLQMMMAKR